MSSGYKTITPIKLLNGISAYKEGKISFKSLRVYLSCFELEAIREAAKRSKKPTTGKGRLCSVSYQRSELVKLTGGLTLRSIGQSLAELKTAELLIFQEKQLIFTETPVHGTQAVMTTTLQGRKAVRPIPVPRRFLRFLAGLTKPALLLTIIAYLIRGLSFHTTGAINSRGTIKASWISQVFNISLRAVKAARAEMIALGLISKDQTSYQRKLNRDGSYFEINATWENSKSTEKQAQDVDNLPTAKSESAPPKPENSTQSAPPIKRLKTLNRIKNQKVFSGVCTQTEKELPPNINNIQPEDFKSFSRNETLYWQARQKGLISASEADILNWIATSIRARNMHNPAKIFMGIVKKKLWHHITNAQEDEARAALNRRRRNFPDAFRERGEVELVA